MHGRGGGPAPLASEAVGALCTAAAQLGVAEQDVRRPPGVARAHAPTSPGRKTAPGTRCQTTELCLSCHLPGNLKQRHSALDSARPVETLRVVSSPLLATSAG